MPYSQTAYCSSPSIVTFFGRPSSSLADGYRFLWDESGLYHMATTARNEDNVSQIQVRQRNLCRPLLPSTHLHDMHTPSRKASAQQPQPLCQHESKIENVHRLTSIGSLLQYEHSCIVDALDTL
eukprot:4121991-Pleurochrysis_carterae.AAC.1